jgi:hypothetical protein
MMIKSLAIVLLLVMLFCSVFFLPELVSVSYAQNTTGTQPPITTAQPSLPPTTLEVKITTPTSNQQLFLQNNNNRSQQLTGTSTDTVDTDCQVSVISNDIRPYQNTTATGPGGKNDYSTWSHSLVSSPLKEGSNKVTARISCVDSNSTSTLFTDSTNQVKHSSVFFTILNATAGVTNGSSTTPSNSTKPLATMTTTTGPSFRTGAVPYFLSNPSCQVDQSSHDLNCNIKIAGIENIDKIRPFLHADLTSSCTNPEGNTPPDNVRVISLIGDSETVHAVVEVNCTPPMIPSYTYENVKLQVGDVILSFPGTFSNR